MSSVEAPIINEMQSTQMARGCAFLTEEEAKLLRFRSRVRHVTVSSTIQELVQPALVRLENAEPEERQRLLDGFLEQVFNRTEVGLNVFQDRQKPPFTEVYWVLPKPFVSRIENVVLNTRISRDSLINSILSDAVNMKQ